MTAKYTLNDLPYNYDALQPVISAEIMQLHHDKHHAAYVNGVNSALESLEKARNGDTSINVKSVLNSLSFNLNGHLMHDLFWRVMRPALDNNAPTKAFLKVIETNFGSLEMFKAEFATAAKTTEGSGWATLSKDRSGNLLVNQVEKHNLLHIAGFTPILALDVWEHAYYLDYKNDRAAYIESWWKVVNWAEVESLYTTA